LTYQKKYQLIMKKLALLLTLAVVFISCEGPQGPRGFDGRNGDDFVAQSYEITGSFSALNNYEISGFHPVDITVFESDMILVYISWETVTAGDGLPTDVWRLVPQTIYSDFGEFSYNYDSTFEDIRIFLDGPSTTDFNLLAPADTDNQIFRVVILPADLANDPTLDITDYNSVMHLGGITETDILKVE